MFKPNPEVLLNNRKKAQLLVDAVKDFAPGTTIPWSFIQEIIDIKQRRKVYVFIVLARKMLEESHGVFIENLKDVGYHVVAPPEQPALVSHRWKLARRRMGRVVKSANCIRLDRITDESLRNKAVHSIAKMSSLFGMLRQGRLS